mgnify:CR=1 FL=1
MSLNGELKHLFGNDTYNAAMASMKTLPDSKMIKLLAEHANQLSNLSGEPEQQRDYVNTLPDNERIALCRVMIK